MPLTGDARSVSDGSYRDLIESILHLAVCELDADGTVATWNAAAQSMTGYASDEIVGRNIAALYDAEPLDAQQPAHDLAAACAHGRCEVEGWRLRRDGSRFWARIVIAAMHDDAGRHTGFVHLARDVTDQAFADEQRRILLSTTPNGMLVTDPGGTITTANARAEQLFGFDADELRGISILALLHDARDETAAVLARCSAADSGATFSRFCGQFQCGAHRRDGTPFAADVTFRVAPASHGPAVIVSVADVTARREAEDALVEANRLMSLAEAMAHCGHWRIDVATRAVFFSAEMLRIHGFDAHAAPSIEAGLAAFDRDGVDVRAILDRALREGQPFTFESRITRPDGSQRDVRVSGQSEYDGRGKLVALVGFILDITDQRRTEGALRNANRLMTMAEEMAHYGHWHVDLRTNAAIWSDEVYRICGWPPGNPPTLQAGLAAYGERAAEIDAILRQAAIDGRPFSFEARRWRPDGTYRDVRVAGRGERDGNGCLGGLFGVIHDVTEIKDAERERKWSTTFQRAVLPLRLPERAGYRFDAVYEPGHSVAQVGGDWYDAFSLIDGRVLVSIGDVAGSGLEAAVVVGVVRQVMRGVSQLHADPMLILNAADRALRSEYPGVYVSAWVGVIDLIEATITYASAGHPPPIMVSTDGSINELHDPTTLLIGLREAHRGQPVRVPIADGDTLVLYTDGISEAGRDVLEGQRLVREAAALLAIMPADRPATAIKQHVIPGGTSDDVAILVVRTGRDEVERLTSRWQFDAGDAAAACAARRAFRTALEEHRFGPDDGAAAELIFGELVGNVMQHVSDADTVEVILDRSGEHSVLHVLDRGHGFHHVSALPIDPFAESGRGLFLVGALALDIAVTARADGGSHARAVLRGGDAH